MRIFLVGFMGSGKSTLGKCLAEELRVPFVDLDIRVEQAVNQSVSEFFKDHGEAFFREMETRVLAEVIQEHPAAVIALGGGTPCFNNNMILVNNHGTSIYLHCSNETLVDRLKSNKKDRPLIADLSDNELGDFIKSRLNSRVAFYNQANYRVNVADLSVEVALQQLIDLLQENGLFTGR